MGWIELTPETMPPDKTPVIAAGFHIGLVVSEKGNEKFVATDVRWNNALKAWEIKEWNICQFEWTTWHDMKITHWMPYPNFPDD